MRKEYLYIISQVNTNYYKVGITNNLNKRITSLQTGNPAKLYFYRYWIVSNSKEVERILHSYLAKFHIHLEWFDIPDIDTVVSEIELFILTKYSVNL